MTPDEIQAQIQVAFPGDHVRVIDTVGDNNHFEATVISARFEGVSRVRRHQMVYEALGDAMKHRIHALALRTLTPDQAPVA
jgi:stress-induced morphogen